MESVVVWSSMSSVTVVPALLAAWQIALALSRATRSPSPGSACPMADSLTETSAPRGEPAGAQILEQQQVGVDGRLRLGDVEGVLAQVVQAHLQPVVDQRPGALRRRPRRVSPATNRETIPLETGIVLTSLLSRSLRDSMSRERRSTGPPCRGRWAGPGYGPVGTWQAQGGPRLLGSPR